LFATSVLVGTDLLFIQRTTGDCNIEISKFCTQIMTQYFTENEGGFLPPLMTEIERDDIVSPAEGLVVYNTTSHKLNVYTGSAWEEITSA
jgi:hypothetical protein